MPTTMNKLKNLSFAALVSSLAYESPAQTIEIDGTVANLRTHGLPPTADQHQTYWFTVNSASQFGKCARHPKYGHIIIFADDDQADFKLLLQAQHGHLHIHAVVDDQQVNAAGYCKLQHVDVTTMHT